MSVTDKYEFAGRIVDWLRPLIEPGSIVEFRALELKQRYGRPVTRSGFYEADNLPLMAMAAYSLNGAAKGIYYTINPLHPDLLSRRCNREDVAAEGELARDAHVLRRRFILIDADPKRLEGVSSSNAEKEAARVIVEQVRERLTADGWPQPVLADSGSGWHLQYRIDLPADDGGLVQRCLQALAAEFNSPAVTIDRTVFNPSRICKLYGTLSKKGDSTTERPHRYSAVVDMPAELVVVPQELIEALAAKAPTKAAISTESAKVKLPRDVAKRARNYVLKMDPSIAGQDGSGDAFEVACVLIRGFAMTVEQALPIMQEYNATQCEPPWSENELLHKLRDAATKSTRPSGYLLDSKSPSHKSRSARRTAAPAAVEIGDTWTGAIEDGSDSSLPEVMLPGENSTITQAAETLGDLLAGTGKFYTRDGTPMRTALADGEVRLEPLRNAAACSDFEALAHLVKERHSKEGPVIVPAVCSETTARQILESQSFRTRLPRITVLSRCPVLIDRGGELVTITGYDRESGIWAMGDEPPALTVDRARQLLCDLLADFHFASEGDRSRALAALITPAMVFGGLLRDRAPIDVGEADESQSGKGYRNKVTTAIYRNKPKTVTQRERGVGSMQETFDAALIGGACFPSFDNLRGKFESAAIESFMTESSYYARVPYASPIEIDATRIVVMLTTNKAELTRDLANRSSIVRIRKHGDDFKFRDYPEGDLLQHVQANQRTYLAAVFAIVREWHRLGKPRLETAAHDFHQWAKVLGWIVEHILGAAHVMADHREIQARVSSPAGNWLRDLAFAVRTANKLDEWLRTYQLLDIVIEHGVQTPGIGDDLDVEDSAQFQKATRALGRKLSQVMKQDSIVVDGGMRLDRQSANDSEGREKKSYKFTVEQTAQVATEKSSSPNAPPMGTQQPPISPIDPTSSYTYARTHIESPATIGGIGGIGGKPADDCDHLNPATWIQRGGKAYCEVCNTFMACLQPEASF